MSGAGPEGCRPQSCRPRAKMAELSIQRIGCAGCGLLYTPGRGYIRMRDLAASTFRLQDDDDDLEDDDLDDEDGDEEDEEGEDEEEGGWQVASRVTASL